jgi:hypothetical protein
VKKVGLDFEMNTNPTSSSDSIGSSRNSGSYAYWVGDEGLKAKISMPRTEDALVSTGFGVSIIPGFEDFESKIPAQTRSRLLNEASVADATKTVSKNTLHARFHDVTVHGHGVLADVRSGGLRRDLTAGLQPEAKDSEGNLVLTGEEQIFTAVGGASLLVGLEEPGSSRAGDSRSYKATNCGTIYKAQAVEATNLGMEALVR